MIAYKITLVILYLLTMLIAISAARMVYARKLEDMGKWYTITVVIGIASFLSSASILVFNILSSQPTMIFLTLIPMLGSLLLVFIPISIAGYREEYTVKPSAIENYIGHYGTVIEGTSSNKLINIKCAVVDFGNGEIKYVLGEYIGGERVKVVSYDSGALIAEILKASNK